MTSTLYFYKLPINLYDKNFILESLETYLATLTPVVKSNFQYQRFEMEKRIKVNISQDYQTYNGLTKYNYLKITELNEDNSTAIYYYFIKSAKQISESTIEFILRMDVLNTFKFSSSIGQNNYNISDKSLITREHKNRFKDVSTATNQIVEATYEQIEQFYNALVSWEYPWEGALSPKYFIPIQLLIERITKNWNGYIKLDFRTGTGEYLKINDLICASVIFRTDSFDTYDVNGLMSNSVYYKNITGVTIQFIYTEDDSPIVDSENNNPADFWRVFFNTEDPYSIEYGIQNSISKQIVANVKIANRDIDIFQEGINTFLFKDFEEKLYDFDNTNTWYIIFSSANGVVANPTDTQPTYVNPVKILIGSDESLSIKQTTAQNKTIPASLIPKKSNVQEYLVLWKALFTGGGKVIINGVTYDGTSTYWSTYDYMVIRKKNNNDVVFADMFFAKEDTWGYQFGIRSGVIQTNFESFTANNINKCWLYTGYNISNIQYNSDFVIGSTAQATSYTTDTFDTMDLTDPKLIKIINVPYCPVSWLKSYLEIETLDDNYSLNADFNMLEAIKSQEVVFDRTINFMPLENPFSPLKVSFPVVYNKRTARDIYFESKLYHSDYYVKKFVYDSFGFHFKLEEIDTTRLFEQSNIDTFNVRYFVTRNIQSKFMFQFEQYVCRRSTEDYENVLIIERNNEKAIYNNAYINYLRAGGYSYDTKKASSQNVMNGISTAFTILGAIGSFASTPVTGVKGVVAGVSLATASASSILRSIHTAQEQDRAIAQKQLQLQNQGTNVSNCEDVDILTAFSGNKAKLVTYECSQVMKNAMWDLFHYCGYATHEQKKPVVNTRVNFNFVQGEIILQDYTFNEDIAQEIINKWKEGVTFMHWDSGSSSYDLKQEYENFEVSLFN